MGRGVTVPFYLAAGVAASEGGAAFERITPAPLLDRSPVDPIPDGVAIRDGRRRAVADVVRVRNEWRQHESGPRHYYNVRYAESATA